MDIAQYQFHKTLLEKCPNFPGWKLYCFPQGHRPKLAEKKLIVFKQVAQLRKLQAVRHEIRAECDQHSEGCRRVFDGIEQVANQLLGATATIARRIAGNSAMSKNFLELIDHYQDGSSISSSKSADRSA